MQPKGLNEEEYKNYKDWSNRKWAWEFLRRNDDFRQRCRAARTETDQQEVADDFGLKRFKHYREGNFSRKLGWRIPIFKAGAISSWSNVAGNEGARKRHNVTLAHGQTLIRFDLAAALTSPRGLRMQLANAQKRIEARIAQYVEATGKEAGKGATPHRDLFIRHLRLLDLLHSKHTEEQALAIVNKDDLGGQEVDANSKNELRKQMVQARYYAERGYIDIAMMKDAPKPKPSAEDANDAPDTPGEQAA